MSAKNMDLIRPILRVRQRGLCCYCLTPMTAKAQSHNGRKPPSTAETVEHLRRKKDGGTNRNDNLALACLQCNSGRGSMDWLTYASYRRGELSGGQDALSRRAVQ